MSLTLNQIVDRVRTLSLSHKQVKTFYFGDRPEFDANGEIVYGAVFLEIQPGRFDRTEHLQFFNFRLYCLDLVPESTDSEANETEVLSDMHSVAADILAMLMYSGYQDDWVISDIAPATPVTEYLNDMDAGVYVDVEIGVDFLADRCQVPAEDVTFETDFDMSRTKIVTYDATGSEGNSFSVSVIAGKVVLAAYRAGQYKRVKTTTPDTECIQLSGVTLYNDNGIATTGMVTLATNDQPVLNEKFDFLIYE